MVTVIKLKQVSPSAYTFNIRNRQTFDTKVTSPVMLEAMPESAYSAAILTKMEGNTCVITLGFKLLDATGAVTTLVDELTGGNAILTPMEQYNFLVNTFENKGILYKYQLSFTDADDAVAVTFNGIIQELTINQVEADANNWTCTVQFVCGTVIAVDNP